MYDARLIANEFVRIAKSNGRKLTNLQVQKLVYIAYGYCLAIFDEPLTEQLPHASRLGPVIPVLYDSLKRYGSGYVTEPIKGFAREKVSENHQLLIRTVADTYSRFSGPQLATLTHREGTPWSQVYDPRQAFNNDVIPDDLIEAYYSKLLDEPVETNAA